MAETDSSQGNAQNGGNNAAAVDSAAGVASATGSTSASASQSASGSASASASVEQLGEAPGRVNQDDTEDTSSGRSTQKDSADAQQAQGIADKKKDTEQDKAQDKKADTKQAGQKDQSEKNAEENAEKKDPLDLPIKEWKNVKLSLTKEELDQVNVLSLESFGQTAQEIGLTARQADRLVSWQLDQIREARTSFEKAQLEQLQKSWGNDFAKNERAVLSIVSKLDRALGDNRFSKAMALCGGNSVADVQEGLLQIARAVSEDSIGSSSGAGAHREETALDGIRAVWEEQRRGRR